MDRRVIRIILFQLGRRLTSGQQNIPPEQEATSTFTRLLNPDGPSTNLTNGAIWVAQRLWAAHPDDLYLEPHAAIKNCFALVWHDYPEPELELKKCKKTMIVLAQEDSGAPVVDMIAVARVNKHSFLRLLPVETFPISGWTRENVFGRPFFVRPTHPEERPLCFRYLTLSQGQKVKVALELGYRYRCLMEVKHSAAGKLAFDKEGEVVVRPFHENLDQKQLQGYEREWQFNLSSPEEVRYEVTVVEAPPPAREYPDASSPDATYNMLMTHAVKHLLHNKSNQTLHNLWKKVCVMIHEMNIQGWFEGVKFTLSDPSHQATNIWINDQANDDNNDNNNNTPRFITSYETRWAVLAPAFMACRPPTWLWSGSDIVEKELQMILVNMNILATQCQSPTTTKFKSKFDESSDSTRPGSPAMRLLKIVFDTTAGPDFVKFAYTPQYQLARIVGWFMITEGMDWHRKKEDKEGFIKLMEWTLAEWDKIKHVHAPVDPEQRIGLASLRFLGLDA